MIKPWQTLFFLFTMGVLCLALMIFFPKEGIKITDSFSLQFASLDDFLAEDTTEVIDVEALLKSYEEPVDSSAIKDSIARHEWNVRQQRLRISYAEGVSPLPHFFNQLDHYNGSKKVRIIHYGDSQIEGDRISSFLRDKFQKEYGGYGPNYVPAIPAVPSMSVKQEVSENWKRYTVFGRKDSTLPHNRFGAYGIFGRFTSFDKSTNDTAKAWIRLSPSNLGYSGTRTYRKIEMIYGNAQSAFHVRLSVGDSVLADEWVEGTQQGTGRLRWSFSKTPKDLLIQFKAVHSPDVYAFLLEDSRGFAVDNVAMRGSSGTVFSRINNAQLRGHYNMLKPSLILMQYGGNTVPYIKSTKKAEQYGQWFKGQLALVKQMNPEADIVVIGPSDMATKEKTNYVSYPYLVDVRNALKKVTLESGCGFWDIYEVMGGHNSMKSWVDSDPPLAAKDYVHFTPKGARHVAELFYDALMKDYEDHRKELELRKAAEEEARKQDSLKQLQDSVFISEKDSVEK